MAIAGQHGLALWSAIGHDGGNMSGYYVLLHVLIGFFGNTELLLRFPSAIATSATVAIVCLIALRLFDRRAALAAGLLTAVSLPLVFWGQSARSYSLLVAFSAGSFLALIALVDGRRQRVAWVAYVLCTALAIYASLMAILIVPAQLVVLRWHRDRARALGAALLAVAVCCIPLGLVAATRGSGQLFWVSRPDLIGEKQVLAALTSAGLEPNINPTSTTDVLMALTAAALVAIAGWIVWRRESWGPPLVLSWLVVPVALAWLESLVGQPIFLPRNLLMVVPAASLLLAWGITRPSVPGLLTWSSLAVLLALRALQVAPSYGVSPEGWQAASAHVLSSSLPGDCIAFYPSDGRQAFGYYLSSNARPRAPRPVLPAAPYAELRTFVEDYASLSPGQLDALPAGCRRLWFVSSHVGLPNGPAGSRAHYARYLTLRSALERRYPRHLVSSYGYADPVQVELLSRS